MAAGPTVARSAAAALVALMAVAAPAAAVEYRLQVASMHETVFASYAGKPESLGAGATGPGLDRLETQLDAGEVGTGGLLFDRHLLPAPERLTRLLTSARIAGQVQRGGQGNVLWDDVRWEGEPSGQTLWLVRPEGRRPQELVRVALKGAGPLRVYQPAGITASGERLVVVRLPLGTLIAEQEKREFWGGHIGPALDVTGGLAVIVGVNEDRTQPDLVLLLVSQDLVATAYTAVLVWRGAIETNMEVPAKKGGRRGR